MGDPKTHPCEIKGSSAWSLFVCLEAAPKSVRFIISPLPIHALRVTAALLSGWAFFNPVARGQEERLRINLERVDYWISKGAQTSERVANLVKDARKAAQ